MIEMNYEALITDLEGQSRRLIEFLGFEWEPACMDFHRTERSVATVSYWQVRQPLYQSSVRAVAELRQHLGPLFAALRSMVDEIPVATGGTAASPRSPTDSSWPS